MPKWLDFMPIALLFSLSGSLLKRNAKSMRKPRLRLKRQTKLGLKNNAKSDTKAANESELNTREREASKEEEKKKPPKRTAISRTKRIEPKKPQRDAHNKVLNIFIRIHNYPHTMARCNNRIKIKNQI